ncbi:LacI family DNA-binding transcriptional regulator [uncultured Microbacterium sp.]|uniref:LacI family DNA-binding transcriptional regulator n=1 Tax=uncultured Microbacterium sp. TaxID=191216 RepID=UPI0035CA1EF4
MSSDLERGRAPSIRDVARLAGVSHQTVSRVLNDHHSIRDETRSRVERAMETLRYKPNRAARMLVTSRSHTLGVLLATVGEYGPSAAIAALQEAARERGYIVTTANIPAATPEAIADGVRILLDQGVEGIVVSAPQTRTFDVIAGMEIDVPYVSLQSVGSDARSVDPHQLMGAKAATEHLISLGHTGIVHLAGPQDWIEADARMRGFLEAVSDADLPTMPPIAGDWTADFGYFAGYELLRRRDFTAVFAANDLMAIGLLHAFRDAGLDVPGDVSVVGFDDIPIAAHVWPPLSTIHQDFGMLGRRAVATLLGEPAPEHDWVATSLVMRGSTAPPRAG